MNKYVYIHNILLEIKITLKKTEKKLIGLISICQSSWRKDLARFKLSTAHF